MVVHPHPLSFWQTQKSQKTPGGFFFSYYIWSFHSQPNRNPCPSDLVAEYAANDFPRHIHVCVYQRQSSWRCLKGTSLLFSFLPSLSLSSFLALSYRPIAALPSLVGSDFDLLVNYEKQSWIFSLWALICTGPQCRMEGRAAVRGWCDWTFYI